MSQQLYKVLNLKFIPILLLLGFVLLSCNPKEKSRVGVLSSQVELINDVIPGAEHIAEYYNFIQGKKVGLVVNQTSMIGDKHLVDSLLEYNVDVSKIFAPEHGFRGEADAGEKVQDGKDHKTGLPIISLYGKNRKPSQQQLDGLDILVFDIQDVGVRFYTYISTLHYIMEAAAEAGIPVVVLDRPNPNGHYIDGPIMEEKYKSFVGMHPVPVVYGMTIGEYATMINGEQWLKDNLQCDLTVIPITNYDHNTFYELPVKPSPNLPNIRSILLYPSLCFFEGTNVSIGRGTTKQFQVYGHPEMKSRVFSFVPKPMEGAKNPKLESKECFGVDLSDKTIGSIRDEKKLNLSYLIDAYEDLDNASKPFFLKNNFFEKLAGTASLRNGLINGLDEAAMRSEWSEGLGAFQRIRNKYLLYD